MNKNIKKALLVIIITIVTSANCYAQPYGQGVYNENIPYGDATSLSISTDGNVSIPITPTNNGVLSTGTSIVTVTSTDVEGYKLYIRALDSTDMNNLGALLPTSANGTPNPLAMNTWGYNLDASNNFVGITLNDVLIRSLTSPTSGDITTVTYGINLDLAKPAGNYAATVVYTAVPQTD